MLCVSEAQQSTSDLLTWGLLSVAMYSFATFCMSTLQTAQH